MGGCYKKEVCISFLFWLDFGQGISLTCGASNMFVVLVSQSHEQGPGTPVLSRTINGRGLWLRNMHCSENVTGKLEKADRLKGKLLLCNIHIDVQLGISLNAAALLLGFTAPATARFFGKVGNHSLHQAQTSCQASSQVHATS